MIIRYDDGSLSAASGSGIVSVLLLARTSNGCCIEGEADAAAFLRRDWACPCPKALASEDIRTGASPVPTMDVMKLDKALR
jgi:hypothetical protein